MSKGIFGIIGGIIGAAVLFFLVWAWRRNYGMPSVITYYIVILFILLFLAVIIGIIIWAVLRRKKDMVEYYNKAIINSCLQCQPDKRQILCFEGDPRTQMGPRKIGYVCGISRIYSVGVYVNKKVNGKLKKEQKLNPMPITFIAFNKSNNPLNIFKKTYIAGLLSGGTDKNQNEIFSSDHTSLNGDIIYLKDSSFMPMRYGMFFLSRHYNRTWLIDECVKKSIDRYLIEEGLSQSLEIIDSGLSIADKFKRDRETSHLKEISQMSKGGK